MDSMIEETTGEWAIFTKRTDGLKLDWLRKRLTDRGIRWRDAGFSFHAPILEVESNRLDEAWEMLWAKMPDGGFLDDVEDDDPRFALDVQGEAYPWDLTDDQALVKQPEETPQTRLS